MPDKNINKDFTVEVQNILLQQKLQELVLEKESMRKEDEIDLMVVFLKLWKDKWIVVGFTLFFAIASVVYALSLKNQYFSEVLLYPAQSGGSAGGSLAQLAKNFGGLASLAGINLGGAGGNKADIAIEILESKKFLIDFITRRDILIPLMAGRGIDAETGELLIDSSMYDEENKVWVRDIKAPWTAKPSSLEAYREFGLRLVVSGQKKAGFITVGVKHSSPVIARKWVTWLIEDVNSAIRRDDILESELNIQFLLEEIEKSQLSEIKSVFFELIQEQTKTIMLANVSKEYALKTIDPAVVPELAISPKRPLIAVVGTLLGGLFSVIFIFLRENYRKKKLIVI